MGKITQIEKVKKLPISPMTFSKAGKRMAIPTNTTLHRMRRQILSRPRRDVDMLAGGSSVGRVRLSRPVITSIVVIMGRALYNMLVHEMSEGGMVAHFRGVFVNGTMAIHVTIIMLSAAGYSDARLRTLDVICFHISHCSTNYGLLLHSLHL